MRLRHVVHNGGAPPECGTMLRHTMFGRDSTYLILGETSSFVHVEVVGAPGLERGTQLRLKRSSAATMQRVSLTGSSRVTRRQATASAPAAVRTTA